MKKREIDGFCLIYENRKKRASVCSSISDYRKNIGCYTISLKIEGEIKEFEEEFNWDRKLKPNNYWTIQENRYNTIKKR